MLCCVLGGCNGTDSNNPRSSLDMSLLERFGEDWVIEAKHVKYNTSHPIGSGGFAQVYKGTYNGSAVAVKVIHAFLLSTPDKCVLVSFLAEFKRVIVRLLSRCSL